MRLGFGCAQLLACRTSAPAHKVLEAALDHGIRHFDVGRSYGDGRAEAVLGEVARRRRDEMIIVSKAGIDPPGFGQRLRRKLSRFCPAYSPPAARRNFAPAHVRRSVHQSLRALRSERIEALLLHECSGEDVGAELIEELKKLRQAGCIGRFGLATSLGATRAILHNWPGEFELIQLSRREHLAAKFASAGRLEVTHSVLRGQGGAPERALAEALCDNSSGVVLFSSSNPAHIKANARLAEGLSAAWRSPSALDLDGRRAVERE